MPLRWRNALWLSTRGWELIYAAAAILGAAGLLWGVATRNWLLAIGGTVVMAAMAYIFAKYWNSVRSPRLPPRAQRRRAWSSLGFVLVFIAVLAVTLYLNPRGSSPPLPTPATEPPSATMPGSSPSLPTPATEPPSATKPSVPVTVTTTVTAAPGQTASSTSLPPPMTQERRPDAAALLTAGAAVLGAIGTLLGSVGTIMAARATVMSAQAQRGPRSRKSRRQSK